MEAFSALLNLFCGEFNGYLWIPLTKGQLCGLWCFFDVGPQKLLNKQSNGRWFKTTWRPCDVVSQQLGDCMFEYLSARNLVALWHRRMPNFRAIRKLRTLVLIHWGFWKVYVHITFRCKDMNKSPSNRRAVNSVDSPGKWSVMWKMLPYQDLIMTVT